MQLHTRHDVSSLNRKVTHTFVFALGLIVACALLTFFSVRWVLDKELQKVHLINISGRQRMLSQRIAYAASQLSPTATKASRQESLVILKDAIDLFDKSHSALIGGSYQLGIPPDISDEMKSLYFSSESALDAISKQYIADTRALSVLGVSDPQYETTRRRIIETTKELLPKLNAAVAQHQKESEATVTLVIRLQHICLYVTLLALWFEARYIFAPLAKLVAENTSELLAQKEAIQHAAFHDPLTDLPNRRFLSKVADDLAKNRTHHKQVGLLSVDLDGFKQVNDTLGHKAGDVVLKQVAKRMLSSVGKDMIVARVGGDEFVILHPKARCIDELTVAAEQLIAAIAYPIKYEENLCKLGCSIGMVINSGKEIDFEKMLEEADTAMYGAKRKGGNRWLLIDDDVRQQQRFRERAALDISAAIESDQFEPYFQPIYDCQTRKLVGIEALVRWRSDDKLMPPSEFMSVAENLGVIAEIDCCIVKKTLDFVSHIDNQRFPTPQIHLNLSMKTLLNVDFASELESMVQSYNLPINKICLEVSECRLTETTTVRASTTLEQLHNLGFQIVLDNCGLGTTSIHDLANSWISCIKIDKSMVSEIDKDLSLQSTTQMLIQMARALEVDVIAEGIETKSESDFLLDIGCVNQQGFLFAKPASADEFLSVLDNVETPNTSERADYL